LEELKSGGVYPSGPCSAWPEKRHKELMGRHAPKHATKVKASVGDMAQGLAKNIAAYVTGGNVTKVVRDERYQTCLNCPAFIEESKRCSDCGCFMEAKTWINADPNFLCPQKKWKR